MKYIVCLLAALLVVGCTTSRPSVDLSQLEAVDVKVAAQVPLRVAVASVVSPKRAFETYRKLVDYLGRKLGRKAEMVQRASYAETHELLRSGRVEVALVCSGAYVEGERGFGMLLLAAPQIKGRTVTTP